MSTLEDLGSYLQAQGHGILAQTLFLGKLPVDAPNVIQADEIAALFETPGPPPAYVHDGEGPSREFPMVSLQVRGKPDDYATPRQRAEEMWLALGRIKNQTINGQHYLLVQCWQGISKLREDDFARPIITCQVRVDKAI